MGCHQSSGPHPGRAMAGEPMPAGEPGAGAVRERGVRSLSVRVVASRRSPLGANGRPPLAYETPKELEEAVPDWSPLFPPLFSGRCALTASEGPSAVCFGWLRDPRPEASADPSRVREIAVARDQPAVHLSNSPRPALITEPCREVGWSSMSRRTPFDGERIRRRARNALLWRSSCRHRRTYSR
jgi:hypothetical protein